jgi:hypothetical protein
MLPYRRAIDRRVQGVRDLGLRDATASRRGRVYRVAGWPRVDAQRRTGVDARYPSVCASGSCACAGFAGYGSIYETVVVLSRLGSIREVCVTIPTGSVARGRGRILIPIPPCGVLLYAVREGCVWARTHAACVGSAAARHWCGGVVPGGDGDGLGVQRRACAASCVCSVVRVRVGGCILVLLYADLESRACRRRRLLFRRALVFVLRGAGSFLVEYSSAGTGSDCGVVLLLCALCLCLCLEGAASLPRARCDAGVVGFALSASRRVAACRSQCGLHRAVRLRGAQAWAARRLRPSMLEGVWCHALEQW